MSSRPPNLLESGIFTVAEAARLIGASGLRVRRWIAGDPQTDAGPILENELGWANDRLAFSFVNLMEIRFLTFFAKAGVNIHSIRIMADEAKRILRHHHPFATQTVFRTDGKKIYAATTEQSGDERLYNLYDRNFELKPIIAQSLKAGVEYDPSGLVSAWCPRPKSAPNVIIHPKRSFGRPTLKDSGIPTETLADAAKRDSVKMVAKWFQISEARVNEAIEFERELKRAA